MLLGGEAEPTNAERPCRPALNTSRFRRFAGACQPTIVCQVNRIGRAAVCVGSPATQVLRGAAICHKDGRSAEIVEADFTLIRFSAVDTDRVRQAALQGALRVIRLSDEFASHP